MEELTDQRVGSPAASEEIEGRRQVFLEELVGRRVTFAETTLKAVRWVRNEDVRQQDGVKLFVVVIPQESLVQRLLLAFVSHDSQCVN